jgi:two-component sensor histidine kinase
MKAYSIPTLIMASVCFTVALYEFLSWSRPGGKRKGLAFALTGLGATAYCVGCCGQYSVDLPAQSVPWLKVQTMALNAAGLAFLWYVAEGTGLVKRRYKILALAWVLLCAASQFADLGKLGWIADRPEIERVRLPFGAEFVYTQVEMGPFIVLQYAAGMALIAYITWVVVKRRRSRDDAEARVLFVALIIFCAALMNDFALDLHLYSSLYLLEYAWLELLLVVGLRRSSEARDALLVKRALEESDKKLRESQATLAVVVDSTPDFIWSVDSERFSLLSFNSCMREYFSKYRDIRLKAGMTPDELAAPDGDARTWRALYARALAEGSYQEELKACFGPSPEPAIMQLAFSVLRRDGKVFGLSVFGKDVTERKRAEQQIAKSLREKETLIKELYHRTKNNMNVIISMLRLQANHVGDERLRQAFAETEDRIMSMSLVHEKLYESSDLSHIDLKVYIEDLAERLFKNYSLAGDRVSLALALNEVYVPIDTAVSCGLIINELVSNALKYAFPGDRRGEIRIELSTDGSSAVRLAFSDDGVGLPEGFVVERDGHLGMRIMLNLAKGRLRADVSTRSGNGFAFELKFKNEPEQE